MVRREQRVFKNSLYNMSGFSLLVLINLLVLPFYISRLSPEGYGTYAILHSLLSFLSLLDFGLATGLVKFVAEFAASQEWAKVASFVGTAVVMMIGVGVFVAAGLALGSEWVVQAMFDGHDPGGDTRRAVLVTAAGIPFSLVAMVAMASLKGLQRYDAVNMVTISVGITVSLIGVLVIAAGGDVFALIVLDLVAAILTGVAFFFIFRKCAPEASVRPSVNRGAIRSLAAFGGYTMLHKIGSRTVHYLPRFVVAAVLGPAAVTSYEIAMKVLNALYGLLGQATQVLLPAASQMAASSDRKEFEDSYVETSKYVSIVATPLFLAMVFFGGDLLTVWVGLELASASTTVLLVLTIAYLFAGYGNVPINYALGEGRAAGVAALSITSLLLAAFLLVPLTVRFGIEGTALAVFVAVAFSNMLFIIVYTRGMLVSFFAYCRIVVAGPLIGCLLLMSAFAWIRSLAGTSALWGLVFAGLAVLSYFGIIIQTPLVSPVFRQKLYDAMRLG